MGAGSDRGLSPHIESSDYERKLAAGEGQLRQSQVQPLKLSEWASLLLHNEVQAVEDRVDRATTSLLMAGHPDATTSKV